MANSLPCDFSNIHLIILVSSGHCWLPRDHGVPSSSSQAAPALLGRAEAGSCLKQGPQKHFCPHAKRG